MCKPIFPFWQDCWQYSSQILRSQKLTWYICASKILSELAQHETRPQNQNYHFTLSSIAYLQWMKAKSRLQILWSRFDDHGWWKYRKKSKWKHTFMATTNMFYSHECIFHREINNFRVSLLFYKPHVLSNISIIISISWSSTSKIKACQKNSACYN